MNDIRKNTAKFYDGSNNHSEDIEFYKNHITENGSSILELGCGTGRITLPLAEECDLIVGIDNSQAMLDICQEKVHKAGISSKKVKLINADITKINLDQKFGLIIAPFRVMQNLAPDEAVDGVFRVIQKHLSPDGLCILNVFNPVSSKDVLMKKWTNPEEELEEEQPYKSGTIKQYVIKNKFTTDPFVLYPTLISRYFEGENMKDETRFEVPMRVYYPDEFKKIIEDHGFVVVDSWGGYKGESYGEGGELVVKFKLK
jgi:ubiquinone/menaquinone biosynthesis C-methylase UbiE